MIVALVAAVIGAQISVADRPEIVSKAISAVSSNKPDLIRENFREIVEVGDERSGPIEAAQALKLISGCNESGVRLLQGDTYIVDYQCPARRKVAKGCDSGDLFLILDESRSSFAVAHTRKTTADCPLFAPPPPPGFADPREYYTRTKVILDFSLAGDDRPLSEFGMSTGQIFVAPTTADHRAPMALTTTNLRELFTGCTPEGQVQVDKHGASTSYRCSNSTLNGLYAVDFDYIGKRLWRVWIQTPESRAKMNSASSERGK